MKIMYLMSTNAFSGAENVVCQIINLFRKDKSYEMIYTSEIKDNKTNLDDRNIDYYDLKKFNYKNVKSAIRDLKPDIIHAHDAKAVVMACLCSKHAKIIAHIHGNHENLRKFNLKTFLLKIFSNKVDKYIWVSDSALNDFYYCDKVKEKSEVIYNVVSKEELQEKVNEDENSYPSYDIIFLGRLSYPKNPMRALKVISIVAKQKSNLKVAFVGDGELKKDFLEEIKINNLESVVDFYGFVNNPYKILYLSKILLMTSRYEGTPMSALESIALGIPIVSTPTDGLINIIDDGNTGYIDDKDDKLAEKILMLLSDEEKRIKMSNKVCKFSSRINDIDNYKNRFKKIYKEL